MSQLDLSQRDAAEVARSAAEAREIELKPCEVERYLNPSKDTRYGLEFAFHLLGDIQGKTVLDLGCGTGETLVPLLKRGANASGIDISPDLIALACERLAQEGLRGTATVGSAYETHLPDKSVDVIFAMAILHHLDLAKASEEFRRILRDDGFVIVKEPIRYSALLRLARRIFPDRGDISEYEHPLTREETGTFTRFFRIEASRYFRLPFVALAQRWVPSAVPSVLQIDCWLLNNIPWLTRFASVRVMKLKKV